MKLLGRFMHISPQATFHAIIFICPLIKRTHSSWSPSRFIYVVLHVKCQQHFLSDVLMHTSKSSPFKHPNRFSIQGTSRFSIFINALQQFLQAIIFLRFAQLLCISFCLKCTEPFPYMAKTFFPSQHEFVSVSAIYIISCLRFALMFQHERFLSFLSFVFSVL